MAKLSDIIQEYRKRAIHIGLQPTVLADGDPNAQIAVVAEAPGAREVELRTPLVGPTGKFLWQTLQRIGVRRSDCYITNVVKRQIHFSEHEREKITRGELEHWCELLRWEITQLPNVRYILVLGGQALQATVGHVGIEKWRGSCLQDEQGKWFIIANNPAAILRAPYLESTFNMDIYKLQLCREGKYVVPSIRAFVDPSPQEAIRWIDKMHDERLPISLDIETHANETACIGLANRTDEGMCINFRDRNSNRYLLSDELAVRLRICRLLADRNTRIVAQNGIFDSAWLWFKDRIHIHRVWFDTLLAHHTLYPTLPHDLGFLTAQYTHHPYYKDERQVWKEGGDIHSYWVYNVKDCCITLACYEGLARELEQQKLDQFFHQHVMRLQPHLIEMTINGVSVDLDMKRNLDEQLGAEVERLRQEFVHAARVATGEEGLDVNPGSPRQLADLYFSRLRLVARSNSTDKSNREAMLRHPGTSATAKDLILAHNRYADAKKLHSTYVVTTVDDDGRYRSEFRQFGTQSAPGRLSSTGTLWGSGGNFQNQPPKIRPMYIAPPGYEFFYFDLAQAEARVVAYEANIQVWKEQFERARLDGSYDAHKALASEMFRVPYAEVPSIDFDSEHKPTIRYIAKRCRHGLNYRMMHERLAEVTKLPVVEALRIWMIYHRTTPELQLWWKALEHEVTSTKTLFNAYGRRLLYLGPLTEEALESIVAFKPQSLVGDHCTRVIYQSHDDDKWPEHSAILINVHDSLTGIAPIGRGKDCLAICKKYAEAPITIKGEQLIIPADLALSQPDEQGIHRWSNLKKFKLLESGSALREATPVLTVSM